MKPSLPLFPFPSPWQPLICFLSPQICLFWIFHQSVIMQSVCVWLLSLSILFWRFTCIVAGSNTFFLRVIFHCMDTTFCLSNVLTVSLTVNNAVMNIHVQGFQYLFSILWVISPQANTAGSYGNCVLNLQTTRQFSTKAEPFYTATSKVQGPTFSTSLPTLVIFWGFYLFCLFNKAIPAGMKC